MITRTVPAFSAKGLTSLSASSTLPVKLTGVASRQQLHHQKRSETSKARCQRTAASTLKISSPAAVWSSRQAESIAKHLARMQASKTKSVAVQRHMSSSITFSPKTSLRSTTARKVDNSAMEQVAEALSRLTVSASPATRPISSGSRTSRPATSSKQSATTTTTGASQPCTVKKVVVPQPYRPLYTPLPTRGPMKRVKFVGISDRTFPTVHMVEFLPGMEVVDKSCLRKSSRSPTGWCVFDKRSSYPTKQGLQTPDLFDGRERSFCRDCRDVANLGGIIIPMGSGHEGLDLYPGNGHADMSTIAARCEKHATDWEPDWGRLFTKPAADSFASLPLASSSISLRSTLDDCISDNSSNFCPDPEFLPILTLSGLDDSVSEDSFDSSSDSFVSKPTSP